ncbi:MAG: amidophosphoribosyltransferase [Crenarchaeota archaeon]|nr:amidophosphoribosyltransferase [Thermoproteota archaeon]
MGCGVFGAIDFGSDLVFPFVYWGLRAQNHRGHQSYGFLTFDGESFHTYKSLDLVPKIKTTALHEWFTQLPGQIGISNVRYTTSGKCDDKSIIEGTQPVIGETNGIKIAVSFNGNIVNTTTLKKEILQHFPNFNYICDSDLVCNKLLIELKEGKDLASAVKAVMLSLDGAFSVIGITEKGEFFAFKDPHGIKPLVAGHCTDQPIFAFSSETVSLDINGFERDFELEPGELVTVTKEGFHRQKLIENPRKAFCAFEYAYFARPDSRFTEKFVYEIREEFGRNLVEEYPDVVKDSDLIMSVPETGDDSAIGVHEASGLKWNRANRRHRYVTERAFILLDDDRYSTIDRKVNIIGSKAKDKRIIVNDDSIVRGDTTKVIIQKLRKSGAKKIHMFVTFPRIIAPCLYGIDMSSYDQLIGAKHDPKQIAEKIGADTVCYQSIDNMVKAIGCSKDELCLGCITGKYPTPIAQQIADEKKTRFLNGFKDKGRIYETGEES